MSRKQAQSSNMNTITTYLPLPPSENKSEAPTFTTSSSQELMLGTFSRRRPVKTALHQAVTDGRLHQARLLSAYTPDINFKDTNGWTPLMLACSVRKDKIGNKMMKMFLSQGAKVNYQDRMGRTALMIACISGNKRMVGNLLAQDDLELETQDSDGNTALIHAAMRKDASALNMVLSRMVGSGLNVDTRNYLGYTALLIACKLGNFNNALSLITFGKACCHLRDMEFKFTVKEWIKWQISSKKAERSLYARFPHLVPKRPKSTLPAVLPEELSMNKLLTRIYQPTKLKPEPGFKSYETTCVSAKGEDEESIQEEQNEGLHELLQVIRRREMEHMDNDREQERLYHLKTGTMQPSARKREISTAMLRVSAYSVSSRYKAPITLKDLFFMYALNYHKPSSSSRTTPCA